MQLLNHLSHLARFDRLGARPAQRYPLFAQKIGGIDFIAAALGLLLLAGCGSLPPANVESFSAGVTATRNQTGVALQGVTDVTSDEIIDYAAAQKTLVDTNFLPVLPADAVATWDGAFAGLQKYSQSLVLLTSANLTKEYEDAVVDLSGQIKQTSDKLGGLKLSGSEQDLSASLAGAFTELSSLLLRYKAQHDAQVILVEADPSVRKILTTMAATIGAGQNTGLRGTVHAHWVQKKGEVQVAFLKADKREDRRSLAAQYAGLLASEVNQDLALDSLQHSLIALADAHHALANGRSAGLASAISAVEQEVQRTYDLSNRFQKIAHGSTSN